VTWLLVIKLYTGSPEDAWGAPTFREPHVSALGCLWALQEYRILTGAYFVAGKCVPYAPAPIAPDQPSSTFEEMAG
jgi:hypothetical protein